MTSQTPIERFRDSLRLGSTLLEIPETSTDTIIGHLLDSMVESGALKAEEINGLFDEIMAHEAEAPIAIGHGVAIGHARLGDASEPIVSMTRLSNPINMGGPDGRPVHFVFLLLSSSQKTDQHLEHLMCISRLMSDDLTRAALTQASSSDAVFRALNDFVNRSERTSDALSKGDDTPHELIRTGRFAGGVINDIKRRAPHYLSDFRDGLDFKSIGASLFLYFACIAPAVAFGGLMYEKTGGQIGAMEMIVATAVGGVFYAFTSGQPLTIMGGTGPLLIFTAVLYDLSVKLGIEFLPVYTWVGLWTGVFTLLIALFDGSALIRFCTRFTDEIFALLISLIFIFEALKDIVGGFVDPNMGHYTALVSFLLAIGTYYIATWLRDIRKSIYLRARIREFLADFGSVIAISSMVTVAYMLHRADLTSLAVPTEFNTTTGRPWLVDFLNVPVWVWFGSAIPALLCTVLVYLDQNITSRLVNKPDNKLKKGPAFHLDLVIVGIMIICCSFFGLPWLVAATVRSLNHIHALATTESSVYQGRVREHVIHVRETRMTGVGIHVMIGLSVFLLPVLGNYGIEIPMSVLFGLFLYMGVTSMAGNEFWERLKLWAMEPTRYPETHYVRRVPRAKLHLFTGIQLGCLTVLWVVKTSVLALLFPLVIAMMVPIRFFIERFFTKAEMAILDSEEEPEEELLNEVD